MQMSGDFQSAVYFCDTLYRKRELRETKDKKKKTKPMNQSNQILRSRRSPRRSDEMQRSIFGEGFRERGMHLPMQEIIFYNQNLFYL